MESARPLEDRNEATSLRSCWICGQPASSGEHMVKRSDLQAQFGKPSQLAPLFIHSASAQNMQIGSLKSHKLKSSARLCAYCNNTRTQPYDRAWEILSGEFRKRLPGLSGGDIVRANRIFRTGARQRMLGVHLYFVKLFGCHVASKTVPIPLAPFGNAIMQNKAHPNIYLQFGRWPTGEMAGISDLQTIQLEGSAVAARWFYTTGLLGVNVTFAADSSQLNGLTESWHPRYGTTKLTIAAWP